MKKVLLVLAVLLTVVLALASCGGETASSTAQGEDTTQAPVVTTTVADPTAPITTASIVTTKAPDTTVAPTDAGVDILNGDAANRAINPTWKGSDAIAFENHHSVLDFHVALVILMTDSENAIYEDLFMTLEGEEGSDAWELNQDYKWVVTVDGKDYEIKRFSVYHQVTKGYVRMDLGEEFDFSKDVDENGMHAYDVWLRIYDINTEEVAYYAWFTDPAWNGPYQFIAPVETQMVPDANRDPSHTSALLYLGTEEKWYPLSLYILNYIQTDPDVLNPTLENLRKANIESAMVIFSILPILLVYPFVLKFFTKGVTVGSVKG